jgi:hypothetical protein
LDGTAAIGVMNWGCKEEVKEVKMGYQNLVC